MKTLVKILCLCSFLFSINITSINERLLEPIPEKYYGVKSIFINCYHYLDNESLKEMNEIFSNYKHIELPLIIGEEYDINGNLVYLKQINFEINLEQERTYKYDLENRLVEINYLPNFFNVTKENYIYGKNDSIYKFISYDFDSNILLEKTNIYDKNNRKIKLISQFEDYIESIFIYNDKNELKEILCKDKSGLYVENFMGTHKTNFSYDISGNMIESIEFNLNEEINSIEKKVYDSYNNCIYIKRQYPLDDELDWETYFIYDSNNNLIETITDEHRTKYYYNKNNHLIEESLFTIDKDTKKEFLVKRNEFKYVYYE